MRALDIQPIGRELAIKWEDGTESFILFETLRRACPCAGCNGEPDVMGHLHKGPEIPLTAASFQLRSLVPIGTYAVQPVWADGHASGIYSFDYLSALGAAGAGEDAPC
jgi:DUF971 family protein